MEVQKVVRKMGRSTASSITVPVREFKGWKDGGFQIELKILKIKQF